MGGRVLHPLPPISYSDGMKIETITLHDGEVIVYVWTSKRRYVRIDSDSVTISTTNFKRKKKK